MANLEGDAKFQILAKDPTAESLETWRKRTLVLNSARRFRHVKNLSVVPEPMEEARRKLKVGVKATQAAFLFVTAGKNLMSAGKTKDELAGFGVGMSALQDIGTDTSTYSKLGKVSGIANKLKVSTERGIDGSETDLCTRRDVYGANVFTEKPPQGFWTFVWEASQDLTLMILIVCAFISLAVGIPTEGLKEGWYDGVGILLSILIVVFITAINDYRQSLQFRDLDKEKKKILIQVTRGGRRQKVFIFDLVVGDIVHLSIGDQIPADGVYVSGYSLTIDESSLTGESEPVLVSEEKPFLKSGTQVRDGSGVMLVTGVGMNTEWGILMSTLSEEGDDETPLQVKLNGVATRIGKIGLGFAIVTFAVLLTRFFSQKDDLDEWSMEDLVQVIDYFAIAVTIVVVAVPEGLPLAVTLSLAYAMKQMIRDKALVRRLSACETMGSATCICSDKTGTLTTNQMTVVKAFLCGKLHMAQEGRADISDVALETYLECAFQNTNGDVAEHGKVQEFLGSPTETAILRFGVGLGGCFRDVRGKSRIVRVEPFNSVKKRMAVLIQLADGRYRVLCKGASEIVLGNCSNVLGSDGQVASLDSPTMDSMLRVTQEFAGEALRTLCFAYKDLERLPEAEDSLPCDGGMTCVAIVGIKDPVRPGVKEAVSMCFKAGIKVRMVTGDNIETAKAIARECGILTDDGLAVEGQVLRKWSLDEMKENVPLLQVIARSSPSDKLKLVQFLKESGEVVAVTGDGTNDAPALHEADIGLAMGIAGTEVAKGSADVIILDDNFSTIVTVAKWGRSIYTNIQKFVQFQLTVNLVALVVNFTSACLTGRAPLTAVQLLWVNLIMDTLGALALATEPPYDELMEKKPVGRSGTFITITMWRNIFGQAVYQLIVLWVMQFKGKELLHLDGDNAQKVLDTMIFNTFVFCQIFNEINSREMEKLNVFKHTLNNNIFIGVIISTVLFQVMMVEFLGKLANTVHLSKGQWSISVIIGFFSLLVAFVVKVLPAPSMTHVKYLLKNRVILGGIFCLLLSQVVKIELTKVLSKEQWLIFGLIFIVTSVLAVMVRLLPGTDPKSKAE